MRVAEFRFLDVDLQPGANPQWNAISGAFADLADRDKHCRGIRMLTKSDLQSLRQCPRKLWLERHRPDLIPRHDPAAYRRANDGNIVGAKAREQLGAKFLWPPADDDKVRAAEHARQMLLASPTLPAAEVPLVREGLYARADALIPEAGGYVLRETKASTFPLKSDKVSTASRKIIM